MELFILTIIAAVVTYAVDRVFNHFYTSYFKDWWDVYLRAIQHHQRNLRGILWPHVRLLVCRILFQLRIVGWTSVLQNFTTCFLPVPLESTKAFGLLCVALRSSRDRFNTGFWCLIALTLSHGFTKTRLHQNDYRNGRLLTAFVPDKMGDWKLRGWWWNGLRIL